MAFDRVDWHKVFEFDAPVLELVARGTIMYLAIFALVRLTGRRSAGELTMRDFIFVLLIAVGAQNAMLGDHTSISSGLVLVGTLVAWNYGLEVLSYKIRAIEKLVSPPPIQIIRDGKLLRANMRREYLTQEELMSHLREEGVDEVAAIKDGFIESDGQISVVLKDNT